MINILISVLDGLARLCYFAGRKRHFRTGLFLACVMSFGALAWTRNMLTQDTTIYPLPPAAIRATLVNRYVNATGRLVTDGGYEVKSSIAGLFWQTLRFVPMITTGSNQPLSVLDDNLPATNGDVVTLVGKILEGQTEQPEYYLKVMDPPDMLTYEIVGWVCVTLLAIVFAGVILNWLIRRVDYAVTMPLGLANIQRIYPAAKKNPLLLWFGSLGPGYGDVVLRQIPVSFKAIPAEARLTPAYYPDLWAIMIRRPRLVRFTTVATSYGALPAVRLEFEDERGITRNGLIAASSSRLLDTILDVLRFVGQ
jgi:hypothetical protein